MTSTRAITTVIRGTQQITLGARTGPRAALLLIVWALPGVWCMGHMVAHALEPSDHGLHIAISAGDHIAGVSEHHDHGHTHPDPAPVVSTGGTKEFTAPALLATAIDLEIPTSTLQLRRNPVLRSTSRCTSSKAFGLEMASAKRQFLASA